MKKISAKELLYIIRSSGYKLVRYTGKNQNFLDIYIVDNAQLLNRHERLVKEKDIQ